MQNRFTAKDFLYTFIGLLVCGLLFMNMMKTDREVAQLEAVSDTLRNQNTTLSRLETAISTMGTGGGQQMDPELLRQLLAAAGSAGGAAATPTERRINMAELPSFKPGYDIRFGAAGPNMNLEGLPQEWQTAPNRELPADFSPGDTLIISWSTDAQTLTPLVATDAYSRRIFWEVLEPLVHFDLNAPFHYRPGLAREWEVSEDGMVLTFRLFENAQFSDGTPVTADDVIFTWDTVMNEGMDTARYRSYLNDNVESWEKVDDHTVEFVMKQPYFDAVSICGNLLFIIPEHIYGDYDVETFNTRISDVVVGSGPYILEHWRRNEQISLVRNENYWGPKPALERIVIRINTNELANLQEFWAGNIDFMERVPVDQWEQFSESTRLRERGYARSYYSPLGGYGYIGYNLRRPHFADKRTRQALTMLLDREEMIDTLGRGMGVMISGPFFYRSDQYDSSIDPWPFDPARARALLREVGWEDTDGDGILDMDLTGDGNREPFEVTFLVPSGAAFYDELQAFVQQAFGRAGIRVNLDQLDWAVFLERVNERQFDMISLAWTGSPESDPFQIWHSSSEANRGSNSVGFRNAEADRIIEEARQTLDYDKRMSLWHQFHAIVHEEQPYTFLFGRADRFFIDKRFHNVNVHDYRPYYGEWYVPGPMQSRTR